MGPLSRSHAPMLLLSSCICKVKTFVDVLLRSLPVLFSVFPFSRFLCIFRLLGLLVNIVFPLLGPLL